ncbi:MAG TPA: hypothetical protein VLE51_02140 [Candidatus Saccharimonadales bacterium]|nr:hypothetical protein [Candidatus Saccharimonadales bacterium]
MAEITIPQFRDHLLESGVLDPEGIHHEFVSGMHGRKLDFDTIPEDSELFNEWVKVVSTEIRRLYTAHDLGRLVVVSVANGTNRLVPHIADNLGGDVFAVLTEKISAKAVRLTPGAEEEIITKSPNLAVAVEDVGTKGTTSATAVTDVRRLGVPEVEALNTWQRRERLEELDSIRAVYNAVIFEPLPTLTPEYCRESGYCAQGWEFIEHEK